MSPRKVVVFGHQEAEGCWAESPDLPGFTAVAPTMDELRQRAVDGIRFHLGIEEPLMILFVEGDYPQGAPTVWAGVEILDTGTGEIAGALQLDDVNVDFVATGAIAPEPMDGNDVEVEFART